MSRSLPFLGRAGSPAWSRRRSPRPATSSSRRRNKSWLPEAATRGPYARGAPNRRERLHCKRGETARNRKAWQTASTASPSLALGAAPLTSPVSHAGFTGAVPGDARLRPCGIAAPSWRIKPPNGSGSRIVLTSAAKGSCRPEYSWPGQGRFRLFGSPGGVGERFPDISFFQIRVGFHDLGEGMPAGHQPDKSPYRDTQAADAKACLPLPEDQMECASVDASQCSLPRSEFYYRGRDGANEKRIANLRPMKRPFRGARFCPRSG